MNVKIGAKIKALRKRDDVTQEKLAEVLGLTSQAISKWESESGYPDIEYITPIANFFNVTIDYLFNHDAAEKLRKIDEYCKQTNRKLPQERIDIMRQALAEFPAEEKLLFILAEALYCRWKVSCEYDWKECTAIFEELLVSSVDDSIRTQCRWYLAMIYGKTGEKEKLMKIAQTCSSIRKSRQVLLAYAAQGSKEHETYQQEAIIDLIGCFSYLFTRLVYLRADRADVDEEIKDEIRYAGNDAVLDLYIKINKLVFNEQAFIDHNGHLRNMNQSIINSYCSYAMNLITDQRFDEAYEKLENAYKYAKNYDERVKKGEHIAEHTAEANPDECEQRILPRLLYELESKHAIGIPHDPQLYDNSKYTELISRIQADIAETTK